MPSVELAGELRPDIADELGLPAGLPVASGLNDGAAATLGVGAHREGDAVVSLGTNGVLRLLTASPPAPELCLEQALFRYPVVADLWACGGFVLAGGSALAWFAALAAGSDDASAIAGLLDEAAAVAPGSDGVVFLPDLVGRGSPRPDPDAAATFAGLRLRHGRPELARAVLEGVAFGAKDVAAALAAVGLEPARLLVTGGGAGERALAQHLRRRAAAARRARRGRCQPRLGDGARGRARARGRRRRRRLGDGAAIVDDAGGCGRRLRRRLRALPRGPPGDGDRIDTGPPRCGPTGALASCTMPGATHALLDRDRELAEIAALVERARQGEGGVLVFRGPPGSGRPRCSMQQQPPGAASSSCVAGAARSSAS